MSTKVDLNDYFEYENPEVKEDNKYLYDPENLNLEKKKLGKRRS